LFYRWSVVVAVLLVVVGPTYGCEFMIKEGRQCTYTRNIEARL
jgi:hypothetical protein